ncbi:DUF1800 domain-containing protein [Undibacterium sp. TS12]|uniref:DUF1800 domain-containing protein n=1 Tax=Undibacterium sp. TS12 TaxID=2908202 RepID=UPI001F4D206B|nr:DUF1800 domain-containing protein [Undibacterium sp. TS12]MCH8618050.1 DUF1800 domain-containing protein [Undibacterium sp. TS12]
MMTRLNLQHALAASLLVLLTACSTTYQQQAGDTGKPPVGKTLTQAAVPPEQLLNRLSWGSNPSTLQAMQTLGPDRYLDQQLRGRNAILPAAIQAQIDAMTISRQPFMDTMRDLEARRVASEQQKGTDDTLRKEYQQELTRLAREAANRALLRDIYSSNQLQEQMSWFWMNHFNIHSGKHNIRAMLGDFEEQAIRPNALGNFRDLLRATVMHPAMLRYLDNEYNAVNRINENYARELMELHTMGVNGGYSQKDVQELARVLTGVGVSLNKDAPRMKPEQEKLYVRKGMFEFQPQRHDFGDKQILGQTIKGRGIAELDDVLLMLSRQPATARYVSQKLAQFFVADNPSKDLVEKMAQRFLQTDGDIPATLRTMFDSQEFIASLGKKFKDPMHYMLASVRLAYDGNTIVNTGPMLNWLNMMGQQLNGRQTPDGYALDESAWASSGQMTVRFDIARSLANGNPGLFKVDTPAVPAQDKSAQPAMQTGMQPSMMQAMPAPASPPAAQSSVTQPPAPKPPQPALATSNYVKNWSKQFSPATQTALSQASTPQEWNALFLASPEMMRR